MKLLQLKVSCVTFNEQLTSLVQEKPLSHELSHVEYKNDKTEDNISQTLQIL